MDRKRLREIIDEALLGFSPCAFQTTQNLSIRPLISLKPTGVLICALALREDRYIRPSVNDL